MHIFWCSTCFSCASDPSYELQKHAIQRNLQPTSIRSEKKSLFMGHYYGGLVTGILMWALPSYFMTVLCISRCIFFKVQVKIQSGSPTNKNSCSRNKWLVNTCEICFMEISQKALYSELSSNLLNSQGEGWG